MRHRHRALLTRRAQPRYKPRVADPTIADVLTAIHAQDLVIADIHATLNFLTSKVLLMSNVLDPITAELTTLQATVTAETTVEQGAVTLLNGIAGQITALTTQLATAIANQADPAAVSELVTQLHGLGATIQTSSTALAAAVASVPAPTSGAASPAH